MRTMTKAQLTSANERLLKQVAAFRRAKARRATQSRGGKKLRAALLEADLRQSATSEILRVISSSPTDVQPVFDTIVRHAAALVDGLYTNAFRYDGEQLHLVATSTDNAEMLALLRNTYPSRPNRSTMSGRAVLAKAVVRMENALAEPEYDQRHAIAGGWHRMLGVPMLRGGVPLGVFVVAWSKPGPIPSVHEELLKTFADQAVIAIENVRLFNQTKEALERQTATAEILKVISSSPTDTQPVFDAILERATKLCEAETGMLYRYEDGAYHAQATRIPDPAFAEIYRRPRRPAPGSNTGLGRMMRELRAVHIPDLLKDEAHAEADPMRLETLKGGVRTWLGAPLLKEGELIGAIVIYRSEPRAFSEQQISLLQTFADQAVIAIENVRLFKELEARTEALTRSVAQLTALGEVGQAISATLDVETVLKMIVSRALQLTGLDAGVIYEYDARAEQFQLRASENFDEETVAGLRGAGIRKGEGAVGRCVVTREPAQVPDSHAPDYPVRLRELLDHAGFRAVLAVPLLSEDQIIGALMMLRKGPGPFAPEVVEMLKTFASQSALAIQNARLFREIAEKGEQLEVASRHKSDFLSSMSHELRTPLNSILGFNEMLLGEVYGDVPADMQAPLAQIQTSGKHLLRLINNVLDLAKIEAGRMELSLQDYSVHDTVESVRSTLRSLAADKGLEFFATLPADLPLAYGDAGRITQCLMNLAGNSLKFTKVGKVEISVEARGDLLVFKVADTGIGIPPDKLETVFAEFKQTDVSIASEYGGTGLGLSISRKFIEMHGGRIWVESELGKGSVFVFEIPLRVSAGAGP